MIFNKQILTCPGIQHCLHLSWFLHLSSVPSILTVGSQRGLLAASQRATYCACVSRTGFVNGPKEFLGPVMCPRRAGGGGGEYFLGLQIRGAMRAEVKASICQNWVPTPPKKYHPNMAVGGRKRVEIPFLGEVML